MEKELEFSNLVDITKYMRLPWLKGFNFYITQIAVDDLLKVNETKNLEDIEIILQDIVDVIRIQPEKLALFASESFANVEINPRVNLDGNLKRKYNVNVAIFDKPNVIINRIVKTR